MEFSNRSSLDQLHINIRWLKEWKRTKLQKTGFLFPYTAFWLVLEGSAVIELDGIRHTAKAGDLVCIPPRTYQDWIAMGPEGTFHHLSLACEAKAGVFDLIQLYRFPRIISGLPAQTFDPLAAMWFELHRMFEDMLKDFDETDLKSHDRELEREYPMFLFNTDQTVLYLHFRSLSIRWVTELFHAARHRLPEHPVAYDTRVHEVCDYITKHLEDRPTLEELAGRVSLSKEHLRTLFQRELGVPPMKFMVRARLQRARDLLLLTALPVKDIAAAVGYGDQHHFTRAFRMEEGVAPMEFRRSRKAASFE